VTGVAAARRVSYSSSPSGTTASGVSRMTMIRFTVVS
jgi:hypothetical protein